MPPLSELLGPEVTNLGDLVGILNAGDLNAGWFQNVFGELEQMPQRLAELLALIDRLFGPPQADGPAVFPGAQWYPIKKSSDGALSGFYLVTPTKDPGITNGVFGIGVFNPFKGENLEFTAYGFAPLFALSTTARPVFLLGKEPLKTDGTAACGFLLMLFTVEVAAMNNPAFEATTVKENITSNTGWMIEAHSSSVSGR
jgi:hypothetical protein